MPRQRLRYGAVYFWLWLTPALPWVVVAIIQTLGAAGLNTEFDPLGAWLPVVATVIVSTIVLLPSGWFCRRWTHANDLARTTADERRKSAIVFVLHAVVVMAILQYPLIAGVRSGTVDPSSEQFSIDMMWILGSLVISIVLAAIIGWNAIRLVRVD